MRTRSVIEYGPVSSMEPASDCANGDKLSGHPATSVPVPNAVLVVSM